MAEAKKKQRTSIEPPPIETEAEAQKQLAEYCVPQTFPLVKNLEEAGQTWLSTAHMNQIHCKMLGADASIFSPMCHAQRIISSSVITLASTEVEAAAADLERCPICDKRTESKAAL